MNKIKQISLTLSLISMVATVSVSAMENNSEQSIMVQPMASTCWDALSGIKDATYYTASMVAAEAKCLPDLINGVFTHVASSDEDQGEVNLNTNGFSLSVSEAFSSIQNGALYASNYAYNAINSLFIHAALGGKALK